MTLEVRIPQLLAVGSGPNAREHWAAKHRRVAKERAAVRLVLGAHRPPPLPLVVTIIRCAPRTLRDGDNLVTMQKAVRDEVAAWVGVDDGDPGYMWRIEQRKTARAQQGTIVRVEART